MLYPKNTVPLTLELFRVPTSEYRAAPFWAWNSKLDADELVWQIDQLKKMGFGGFHMHVRTGMATRYLSEEYLSVMRSCVEKARAEAMLAWLYDEDRWPSGAAGGFVTQNPAYRARHLLLTRMPAKAGAGTRRVELMRFAVVLNDAGELLSYKCLADNEAPAGGFELYAYEEVAEDDPWYNNQTYVDTLNPEAIAKFLEITHELYAKNFGGDFGGVIPAIFTDEPQFTRKSTLAFAHDIADVKLPWTGDLPESFARAYGGEQLLDKLPELVWDLPDKAVSLLRYRFHDHIAERFAQAFADQCGRWCAHHGLMLTGHLMEEGTLLSQTSALGEAMRSYRSFGLPGIDMLCDWREYSVPKQAQSAARQYGREGVLSELYGVTNWDFDFRRHKLQGDWQAALGVTIRVPHLSWVSMNGEAKRDYPATFNYQSPWFKQYPYIENHYARVNTAMTRGKAVSRIGVIHPIESYWLHWGARQSTHPVREAMQHRFENLINWLLRGLLDFDFICESNLPQQCAIADIGNTFPVGQARYDVILVPGLKTLRATTLKRLEAFRDQGGRVIFMDGAPSLTDAVPDERGSRLYDRSERISFEKLALLEVLEPVREVSVYDNTPGTDRSGTRTGNLMYQLREEEGIRWLFLAPCDDVPAPDLVKGRRLRVCVRGSYTVTLYDTLTGDTIPLESAYRTGWTVFEAVMYEHDSLLARLVNAPDTRCTGAEAEIVPYHRYKHMPAPKQAAVQYFLRPVPVTLDEPNVLLLDMAEYALDDQPWRCREEILRLDNILRAELNFPGRDSQVVQPWVEQDAVTPHSLHLRYKLKSKVTVRGAQLALENAAIASVWLNGEKAAPPEGWYVDKCIGRVALPEIAIGENVLEIAMPYGKKINVEACYLLGDFGVEVAGCDCTLTAPVSTLHFGDITRQGLPFYGGNLTYHLKADTHADTVSLCASCYRGHLIRVAVDGKDAGVIAFSPYRLEVEGLYKGCHRIDVTLYGNRINTFGQLHRNDRYDQWWGPNSWRSEGEAWTYEYRFWPQGVLKSPEIIEYEGNA